jgi:hypothetical protein
MQSKSAAVTCTGATLAPASIGAALASSLAALPLSVEGVVAASAPSFVVAVVAVPESLQPRA